MTSTNPTRGIPVRRAALRTLQEDCGHFQDDLEDLIVAYEGKPDRATLLEADTANVARRIGALVGDLWPQLPGPDEATGAGDAPVIQVDDQARILNDTQRVASLWLAARDEGIDEGGPGDLPAHLREALDTLAGRLSDTEGVA